MAKVYKMMLGTSGKQWEQLTVRDDGTMMLYFHGTARSVTQQVTAVTEGEWKGWLKSEKGSMWPGIESGRWTLTSGSEADNEQQTTADCTDEGPIEQVAEVVVTATESQIAQMQAPCAERFAREDIPQPTPAPRPRRQRKPRKPVAESARRNVIAESRYNDTTKLISDNAWLRSAGYLAAASVALLVIWQTGLIIPLGLIGLATSGFLK